MEMVSVIIPNYNHAQYLTQRMDSILNQTYKNLEVIVLDDCSTDNSKEIIERYRLHPLVKQIVYNSTNSGSPFLQWQQGIKLAKGDWIWFAESDDYADERFLELLLASLQHHQNVGLLYCDSKIVNGDIIANQTFADIKNDKFKTVRWSDDYSNNGLDEIENYLLPAGTINNSSAVLFNKRLLEEVRPFDLNLRYIGDKYTFIKVLSRSNVVYVKNSLNYYRDPFNTKHADRFIAYFYEQFLVFDWVYRSIELNNRKLFFEGFYANTRNSLFRGWNKSKILLYRNLFQSNPYLMLKSMLHNLMSSITSVLSSVTKIS